MKEKAGNKFFEKSSGPHSHQIVKDGTRYGRLTVSCYSHKIGHVHYYKCKCDCGETVVIRFPSFKHNKYGCQKCHIWKNTASGFSRERIYGIWKKLIYRCTSDKSEFFYRYGGRGITVCDEWKNDFMAFYNWAVNNGYKENLTIDRINNDGDYEPSNCRWATRKEQANNNSKNRIIKFNGEALTMSQWAEKIGIKYQCFFQRLKRNGICEKIFNRNMRRN